MKRSEYRKKKRRKRNYSLLFLVSVLLFGGIYWVVQYNSGKSLVNKDNEEETISDDSNYDPFEGAESQFGEMNVLLIGNDARGDEEARSDTLLIGHYNQDSNEVKIVSLMRDTYVKVPGYGQQKLNAAFFFGGPELVRKTIKENFDIDIQYYAIIDFTGFSNVVDIIAPKGIKVDIPYKMSHGIGMTLEPGEQYLDGNQLLGYVRFRHDIHSDFGRVARQQEVIGKLKEEALSLNTILNLPKLLGSVNPYIDTNVTNRTLLTIGKGLLTGGEKQDIETLRIPIDNSYTDRRINGIGDVLAIDLEENKEALNEFLTPNKDKSKNDFVEAEDENL